MILEKLDMTYFDTWNTREIRLKEIEMSYTDFLLSEHWLTAVEKAKSRDYYDKCEFCNEHRIDLHHSAYNWLMTKDELRVVYPACRTHHLMVHDLCKEFGISIRLGTRILRNPFNQYTLKQIKMVSPRCKAELINFLEQYPTCSALDRLLNR